MITHRYLSMIIEGEDGRKKVLRPTEDRQRLIIAGAIVKFLSNFYRGNASTARSAYQFHEAEKINITRYARERGKSEDGGSSAETENGTHSFAR